VRTEPGRHDDVLLTAGGIADNPTAHAGACVEVSQNVALVRVIRKASGEDRMQIIRIDSNA